MRNSWEINFPLQRRVLLVRHGQALGNVTHSFLGRKDDPLTELGATQAKAMANYLADKDVAAIYSSPLKRAATTAQAIADRKDMDCHFDDRLQEQDFGLWDGKTLDQVIESFPEDFKRRRHQRSDFAPTGGETLSSVCHRVGAFGDELCRRYSNGETVVVVGHACVFMAFLCNWLGMELGPTWPFRLMNGTLTEVQFREDRAVLTRLSVEPG
jgi:broad specificity phosphatase PhoE